jgi:proteasome lid subunit RPN8/RPN11
MRFSPVSWAKLLFLRDRGTTEVGGFAVTPADDLLYVEDVRLVRQSCTAVSVAFDDTAVAEFFEEQVDLGRRPEQFARIWIHTHPGESAEPSQVDEETFGRVFGSCDWALMFILARGGETYGRLRFRAGPGGGFEISTQLDFDREFAASDPRAWAEEYANAVRPFPFPALASEDPIKDLLVEEISFGDFPTFGERAEFFGEELFPDERAF